MGTIANKLQALASTKAALKAALVEKGQNPSDDLSTYGDLIRGIQSDSIKLESIEVSSIPALQEAGEPFNPTDMEIDAVFSNEAHKTISDFFNASGYKKLEYIESTGTQFIDTGFIPNQDTKVEVVTMPFSATDANTGIGFIPYGAGEGAGLNAYECYSWNGAFEMNYGYELEFVGSITPYEKATIIQDKNVVTIQTAGNEFKHTHSTATFTVPRSMMLFAIHRSSPLVGGPMKLYSAKIYDNNILVRDMVPCVGPNDEIGMYDTVNKQFYGNNGTGSFVAGTEIDTFEIIGGERLILGDTYMIARYEDSDIVREKRFSVNCSLPEKAIFTVKCITATTSDGTNTYPNETFCLLDVYGPAGGKIQVSAVNTIQMTSILSRGWTRFVFGTYLGKEGDFGATTGAKVEITGNYSAFGQGLYASASNPGSETTICPCIDSITSFGKATTIEKGAYAGSFLSGEFKIPYGITSIGMAAFAGQAFTKVIIPASVTSLQPTAFFQCPNLTSIEFRDPTGWKSGSTSLDLSDSKNNVSLINTYNTTKWEKT